MKLLLVSQPQNVDSHNYCVHRTVCQKIISGELNHFMVERNLVFSAEEEAFNKICEKVIDKKDCVSYGFSSGNIGKTMLEATGSHVMVGKLTGFVQKGGVWGKDSNPIGYINHFEQDKSNNLLPVKSKLADDYLCNEGGQVKSSNLNPKIVYGQVVYHKYIDFELIEKQRQEKSNEFWEEYQKYVNCIKVSPISKERQRYLSGKFGHITDDPVFCNEEIQKEFQEYYSHNLRKTLPEKMRPKMEEVGIQSHKLNIKEDEFQKQYAYKFGLNYDIVVNGKDSFIVYSLLSEQEKTKWREKFIETYMSNPSCYYTSIYVSPSTKLLEKIIENPSHNCVEELYVQK